MMLGAGGNTTGTSVLGSSGDGAGTGGAPTIATTSSTTSGAHEGSSEAGLVGPLSGEEDKSRVVDEGDRTFGGNRWPRQETLALLKIRSDMDVAFRDATVKGPLWEEVSRKLAELGYVRSAKKCKEKFENVYKYHKRTKEGRTGKPDGKTYRFFDQLQALENHPSSIQSHQQKPQSTVMATTTMAAASNPPSLAHVTVPSTTALPSLSQNIVVTAPTMNLTVPSLPPANPTIVPLPPPMSSNPTMNPPPASNTPSSFLNIPADLLSNSTSSSTSSDVELGERRKRKRKWKDFFEGLMREVIAKQEELHRRFLEAIEKREHDRMVREEAWRMQEMSRINREREILAQERSITAAKDAAVMAFLQKLSEQQNLGQVPINLLQPLPQPQMQQQQPPPPAPTLAQPAPAQAQPVNTHIDTSKTDNGDQNFTPASSSRWPKVEVQALIRLRTDLDSKYQDSGPKGPLWEEISAGMRKLGYNRNAKRCKEKWENINKYFKKVKESNKKRPEDSKTCPYFHQLDALYREKNKVDMSSNQIKPENSVPLMVRPEQQWPPPPPLPHEPEQHRSDNSVMEDLESEHMDQNHEDDDKDGDDEEDDEGGDGYEIVAANRTVSVGTSHE